MAVCWALHWCCKDALLELNNEALVLFSVRLMCSSWALHRINQFGYDELLRGRLIWFTPCWLNEGHSGTSKPRHIVLGWTVTVIVLLQSVFCSMAVALVMLYVVVCWACRKIWDYLKHFRRLFCFFGRGLGEICWCGLHQCSEQPNQGIEQCAYKARWFHITHFSVFVFGSECTQWLGRPESTKNCFKGIPHSVIAKIDWSVSYIYKRSWSLITASFHSRLVMLAFWVK